MWLARTASSCPRRAWACLAALLYLHEISTGTCATDPRPPQVASGVQPARADQPGRSRPTPAPFAEASLVAFAGGAPSALLIARGASESPPAIAQLTPRVQPGASFEPLFVAVRVNDVSRGDSPALRGPAGEFYLPLAEFRRWGVDAPADAVSEIQGTPHVLLSKVTGLQFRFDEKAVALDITLDAAQLPATVVDLRWRYPEAIYPNQPSAFFNYSLATSGDDGFNARTTTFATEVGARVGDVLLFNSGMYRDQPGSNGYIRLDTNLTYDLRDSLQRFVAGDLVAPSTRLRASILMGGLSLSKQYGMDPYYVQYPTVDLRAVATTPSEVEVRLDGQLVSRRQVAPGPLDVSNVTGYIGAHNVTVVVRDAFGREQVLSQPFYYSELALRKGLHDYSYNVGYLREEYGVSSNQYGSLAFSGYHRYAFTDLLTLGVDSEATNEMLNAGPTATILFPRAGILNLAATLSDHSGDIGHAWALGYGYIRGRVNFNLGARHYSREFVQLPLALPNPIEHVAGASLAYSPRNLGTFSVGYAVTQPRNTEQLRSLTFGYNRTVLGSRGVFSLGVTRTSGLTEDTAGFATFRYFFDQNYSASVSASYAGSNHVEAVSLDKMVPIGQGFGFSVGAERAHTQDETAAVGKLFAQYNATYATAGGRYVRSSNDNAAPGYAEAFVAGSIGYVPGRVFLSRPLVDSFAVVKVGDVQGVPVSANNQLIGTTNARGEVVVPSLYSFYNNFVGFDQQSVPMDYTFTASQLVVSPPLRSGAYLSLDLRRIRGAYGRLEQEVEGERRPIELRDISLTRDGKTSESFVGRRGEFYLDGLDAGDYRLQVQQEPACEARIRIPETGEPVTDLGNVLCVPIGHRELQ
jgi:outer membrane usher protein